MFKIGDKVRLNEDDSIMTPYLVKTGYWEVEEAINKKKAVEREGR